MTKDPYIKLALILLLSYVFLVLISMPKDFYEADNNLLYSEFIQSNNFDQLVKDDLQTFNPRVNGGTYNLGLPMSPQNNNIYGTNRGSRIIPLLVFLNAIQHLFGAYWDRVYFVIALFLPLVVFLISMFFFHSRKIHMNYLVAGFFYSFNPWIINRLNTGFLQLHLAYSFMPIPLLILLHLKPNTSLPRIVIYSFLTTSALTIMWLFQPHFLIMLGILIFIFVIIFPNQLIVKRRAVSVLTFMTVLMFLGNNAYNILPSILYQPFLYTRITTFSLGSVLFNGSVSTLADVVNLIPRPLFNTSTSLIYQNARYLPHLLFYLLFLSAVFFKTNKRRLLIWFTASLCLFIFLSKGLNEPFVSLSKAIYEHIPFMHAFRDPSRLIAAIVLICAVSFAVIRDLDKYKVLCFVYLIYAISMSLIQFRALPINNWLHTISYKKYTEDQVLTDSKRLMHLPNDTAIFESEWYNKSANSAFVSPFEALNPSKSNLATYGGSHDSLFQQAMLYSLASFESQSAQTKYLFNRLHIGKITLLEQPDSYKRNLQLLEPYEDKTRKNDVLIPTSPFISTDTPIFILGEAYDYASVVSRTEPTTPIINLSQYTNASNIMFFNSRKKTKLLTDRRYPSVELTLASLAGHSLELDYETRNYDTSWSPFTPYAKKTIQEGYLLRSGKAIGTTQKDAVLKIFPNKFGTYILALNLLESPEYGDILVYLNHNTIRAMDDEERIHKGFGWRIYKVDITTDCEIDIVSQNDAQTVIDDALLIPLEVYSQSLSTVQKLINEHFVVQSLDSDIGLTANRHTNIAYEIQSSSEFAIRPSSNYFEWLTMKIPYDSHWSSNARTISFISDGYAVSLFTPNAKKILRVFYKPEFLFQVCLRLSAVFFLCSATIALYLYAKCASKNN